MWIIAHKHVTQLRPDDLWGVGVAIHLRHCIVAFGKIAILVSMVDLLINTRVYRKRFG